MAGRIPPSMVHQLEWTLRCKVWYRHRWPTSYWWPGRFLNAYFEVLSWQIDIFWVRIVSNNPILGMSDWMTWIRIGFILKVKINCRIWRFIKLYKNPMITNFEMFSKGSQKFQFWENSQGVIESKIFTSTKSFHLLYLLLHSKERDFISNLSKRRLISSRRVYVFKLHL